MMRVVLLAVTAFALLAVAQHRPNVPKGYNADRPSRIREMVRANRHKYAGCCTDPVPVNEQLPVSFDWCNVDGQNLCTPSWNQHQPKYCGACWVHGTLSAVQDRLKVLKKGQGPDVMLARQVILNCGPKYGLGNACGGGESSEIYEFMRMFGLGDETCYNYLAEPEACPEDGMGFCKNCMMFGGDVSDYKCWPVEPFVKYHVKTYGYVSGEENIMSEVYARGPVTCGVACPDAFAYGYDGGIYDYRGNETDMDHDVEIVGWGEENGVPYWKVRNSWGTYWGENGFFRVVRGKGTRSLRIEEACTFAILENQEETNYLNGKAEGSMFGIRPVTPGIRPSEQFPDAYRQPPHDENKPKEERHHATHSHRPPLPIEEQQALALPATATESEYGAVMLGVFIIAGAIVAVAWIAKRKREAFEYREILE